MASKIISPAINGSGQRKCQSWIASFVSHTENLDAPTIFRKWAAISAISAVLEQKVWLTTSSPLYPNLYVFLLGHPGSGKTRTIRAVKSYLAELTDFHLAPVSLTWASLVDALLVAKRVIIRLPDSPLEYNTMLIAADEIGTFIHKYDKEMTDGLSAFFYTDAYGQNRRGGEIRIKIKSPQINLLCGSTPSNLIELMPESAWGQGFTSRVIMVFSNERIVGDDFASVTKALDQDLIHDLKAINSIIGEFIVTEEYRNLVKMWRDTGEDPAPTHPKLIYYNTRRREQLYKLSMVSAIDRGDKLVLTRADFNQALNWLVEAEAYMPNIFEEGMANADNRAMDEIYHLVAEAGPKGLNEHRVVQFARNRVRAQDVLRVIEVMEKSGMIKATHIDLKTGLRQFIALKPGDIQ